jgi:hypothetical protein
MMNGDIQHFGVDVVVGNSRYHIEIAWTVRRYAMCSADMNFCDKEEGISDLDRKRLGADNCRSYLRIVSIWKEEPSRK